MIFKGGVDISGGTASGDEFAWAIGHVESEIVIVDLVKARGGRRAALNLDATVAECAADLKLYGLTEVLGDKYGGEWPVQSFARHGILYQISPRPKGDLYAVLLPLLTRRVVQLPPDREAVRQLKLLRRKAGSQGRDVIDHPGGGAHDDRANSIALCVSQLAGMMVEPRADMFATFGGESSEARLSRVLDSGRSLVEDVDPDIRGRRIRWDPGSTEY